VEKLHSGFRGEDGSSLSPLQAEQRFYRQSPQSIPDNIPDFLRLVGRELPKLPIDLASIWVDAQRSWWERQALRRELKRENPHPYGDGSAVVIIPGLGGAKWFYALTEDYIERDGNIPVTAASDSLFRFDTIESKKEKDLELIKDTAQRTGKKVHVWGQSQGGIEEMVLYAEHPYEIEDNVADFWDFSGPKPGRSVNVAVGITYLWTQLVRGGNDFRLAGLLKDLEALEFNGKVPIHTIYNSRDAFLPHGIPPGIHHESEGSHIGSLSNLEHLELAVSIMNGSYVDESAKSQVAA